MENGIGGNSGVFHFERSDGSRALFAGEKIEEEEEEVCYDRELLLASIRWRLLWCLATCGFVSSSGIKRPRKGCFGRGHLVLIYRFMREELEILVERQNLLYLISFLVEWLFAHCASAKENRRLDLRKNIRISLINVSFFNVKRIYNS